MQTTYDLVWLAAERTPDHLAIVDDRSDRQLTYRDLLREIDVIAAGLAARGITRGMRVATVLPNLYEHFLVLLALQRLAAVPALMNARLKPEEIGALIQHGEIQGAVITRQAELADTVAAALPTGGCLLSVGGTMGPATDFAACRGDSGSLPAVPRPSSEEPAFIFYTSGTTGLPKGAVLAHRTVEPRILFLATQAGLRHGTHTRSLGFMPVSHCIGFFGVFLVTLAFNGTFYVMSAFDPSQAIDLIARHQITYLFAVPTHFHALVSAPNYAPEKVRSVELLLYGGAPIEPALLERLGKEWAATIRHIYGTTETMNSLYHPEPLGQPAALRPGFYSRVRAVRIGGGPEEVAEVGEEAELIVDAAADATFSGYLNRPDATAEKIRDGWYYTGDVVRREANGEYTFLGRVDDMIRSGGESIHPEEVEAVLAAHQAVKETSVVGIPDPRWGQIVVACVVPAAEVNATALDAHCRASTLAGYKRPKGYLFVDALPRNAANKVLRRVLRDMVREARDGGGSTGRYEAVPRG